MLWLQSGAVLAGGLDVHRRLRQTFENETVFAAAVICLGLLPVAILVAVLFIR
jgi:hypothetical protein